MRPPLHWTNHPMLSDGLDQTYATVSPVLPRGQSSSISAAAAADFPRP
jgi:hypothetical protein